MTFFAQFLKCFCIEVPNSNDSDSSEESFSLYSDSLESLSLDPEPLRDYESTESLQNNSDKEQTINVEKINPELNAGSSSKESGSSSKESGSSSFTFSSFSDF